MLRVELWTEFADEFPVDGVNPKRERLPREEEGKRATSGLPEFTV